MGNIRQLKWWAYKILPLAYDDSLSYYEAMDKCVEKVNELVNNVNELPSNVSGEIKKQLSGDGDVFNNLFNGLINAIATKEGDEVTYTPNKKNGGEIIWLGDTLYEVVAEMQAGTNYIIGTNIVPVDIDGELNRIRSFISTHNEYYHDRSYGNYANQSYLYWKDKLYRVDDDIKVNDIISERVTKNGVTTGQLTQVNIMDEVTAHYIEMHEADDDLQTMIDINYGDIESLNRSLNKEVDRATNRDNSIDNRISNIVAQSGSDNTEIVDARKEADVFGGNTATTVGDAIREQISKSYRPIINENTYNAEIHSLNRIVPFKAFDGDYINIIFDSISTTRVLSDISYNYMFYDSEQNLITSIELQGGGVGHLYHINTGGKTVCFASVIKRNDSDISNITSYHILLNNLTRSANFSNNGGNNSCLPVYFYSTLKYIRNGNKITVYLPLHEANTVGYFPNIVRTVGYSPFICDIGERTTLDGSNVIAVEVADGEYLAFTPNAPYKCYLTTAPFNCVPLLGNISGNLLNYTGNIPIDLTPTPVSDKYAENDKTLMTFQRFGSNYGQQDTAKAITAALNAGYNGARVNLQFTSDGYAVCWHDPYLNMVYRNVYDSEGNLVPYENEADRIYIKDHTLAELNEYTYGGKGYNKGIPQLKDTIAPFRPANKILILELKSDNVDSTNAETLAEILYKNGVTNDTYIAVNKVEEADYFFKAIPECHYGWAGYIISNVLNTYKDRLSKGYKLFWWGWTESKPSKSEVAFMAENNIPFWVGDFQSYDDIVKFLKTDYNYYCTGVETTVAKAGTQLLNTVIKTD